MRTAPKVFAAGIITGALIVAATIVAAPGKAEPDNAAYAYAAAFGGIVCDVLDTYPSFDGILGIGKAIVEDGLSPEQAGAVVAVSVTEICPRHTNLVMAFARQYDGVTA